jgi:hypothetical protein
VGTPSHRLKLNRADEHLKDIEALTKPLGERREYPVIETMKPKRKAPEWEYRLDLSSIQLPERLPILVGDYLFNVRSALDHLVVAIAPRKHRRKVSFPIFVTDPFARDETSGDYLDAKAACRWLSLTSGLPDDCIAALKVLQPYEAAALHGQVAGHHALALLSAFQNADKHRELVDAVFGLHRVELHLGSDETIYAVPVFQDGTVLTSEPQKVDVKVKGAVLVGLQRGQEIWSFDMLIRRLTAFVADEVLPRLEPFLS